MNKWKWITVLFACVVAVKPLAAQNYPNKAIRFIVPVAAGSGFDVTARMISERLAKKFGQPVLVENQPGAGTTLGLATVARASPDGHTIGMMLSPATIQQSLIGNMGFDTRKDLAPIILIGWDFNILVVTPAVPVNSVRQLIDYLKANPDKINYASGGNGTPSHIAAEFFKQSTDTRMVHIPYKAADAAVQDLLGDRVQLMFGNVPATLQHIRAGKLRALAIVGKDRLAALPDVQSMAELGYPNIDVPNWTGIAAPAGTPAGVITLLHQEIATVMGDVEVRERVMRGSTVIDIGSAEMMGKLIVSDVARWAEVIRKAGIKGN
ncbi:MAG: Bug family tripartite tricarboxylate transporter substrate binding protein [Burkholderiales bacterium]